MAALWNYRTQTVDFKVGENPAQILIEPTALLFETMANHLRRDILRPFRHLRMELKIEKWDMWMEATAFADETPDEN